MTTAEHAIPSERLILSYADVVAMGIALSRSQINRLERRGLFPRRLRLGAGLRYGWTREEILAHIEQLKAARDAASHG